MSEADKSPSQKWLLHKDVATVSDGVVKFAVAQLLETLGITPDSSRRIPLTTTARAKTAIFDDSPLRRDQIIRAIGSKMHRITGLTHASLSIHANKNNTWVTITYHKKDVKP